MNVDNLIIDGNNLAYRVHYTFNLSNRGVDVSVTYGFLRVLFSMLDKFGPSSVLIAWDYGIPEHRREALPEYKAQREDKKMDRVDYENLIRQMNLLHRIFPTFGVVSVRVPSCEADDIMYHASKILKGDSVIVTADKDLMQAISNTTFVYNPSRETLYDHEKFEEEYGIEVGDFVDWLAIQGDSVDNIGGVDRVGPKTATKLLNEWGDISAIVNAALKRKKNEDGEYLTGAVADNIVAMGEEKLFNNIYVIALYADRAGAKDAIRREISKYTSASGRVVKRFMMDNAFVSLLDNIGKLKRLSAPKVENGVRYPIVCSYRSAYE